MKLNLTYRADIAFGGEIMPAGTVIGTVELPDACNPEKLPRHIARGVLGFDPVGANPDAEAQAAAEAGAQAEKADTAAEAKGKGGKK